MHKLFLAVVMATCITTFTFPSALLAADGQDGALQRQKTNSGSQCVLPDHDDGLPSMENFGNSDCGFPKRLCSFRHPTTLSYHPEIYNYRHYFNMVSPDANANLSNYRRLMPAVNQPEEILTPVPEQQNQSLQSSGSARLSRPNQKKLQK
jgi:hypothetical protein